MWWQTALVVLVVILAAAVAGRSLFLTLSGRRNPCAWCEGDCHARGCAACTHPPARDERAP